MTYDQPNPLQLGVFGANLDNGCSASLASTYRLTWGATRAVMETLDGAGFEVSVPIARWKGLTSTTHYNGINFETLTWNAGIASVTGEIGLFSTVHVPTIHPIVAARQLTTIDHISGGRAGLNVVCGWFAPEFEMYGSPFMSHEDRYGYAAEWIECVRMLWTREEEFDFSGRYLQIKGGWQQPKPMSTPMPKIMQAGSSDDGQAFQAKFADLAFVGTTKRALGEVDSVHRADDDDLRRIVKRIRDLAREEFRRELEVWVTGIVICRESHAEANAYFEYAYNEMGDPEMLARLRSSPEFRGISSEERRDLERLRLAGFSSLPFVGTPEEIAERLVTISDLGFDGVALHWLDYEGESRQFVDEVLPLLEQSGIRRPRIS